MSSQARRVSHDPSAVFVYNNFNFKDTIKDLALGRKSIMRNLTNCLLVTSPDVHGPFYQSQWRPSVPFDQEWMDSYMLAPPACEGEAFKYLAVNSIKSLFGLDSLVDVAPFPIAARPQRDVNYILQTPAIPENEGEISGVYRVHDALFRDILDYRDYESRLTLVHGDQKTTSFIRAIVASQLEAGGVYDRKQWMLPVPTFFHIMMNYIHLIFRVFWDAFVGEAVSFLGRGQHIQKDNAKYHEALPLLQDAFNGHIVAFLIHDLVEEGVLVPDGQGRVETETLKEALQVISGENGEILEAKLSAIVDKLFGFGHWKDNDPQNPGGLVDVKFRSRCRYLFIVGYLLIMATAVHIGDYGILRQIIPLLPLIFYGGKSKNYGAEMFGWKPIDLALEHVNGAFAIDIKNNKNSTRDTAVIFNRLSVVGPYTATIRSSLENVMRTTQNGRHSTVKTDYEVIQYGCKLYRDKVTKTNMRDEGTDAAPFDAPNLIKLGMRLVADEKIDNFNANVVRPVGVTAQTAFPNMYTEDGLIIESEEGQRLYLREAYKCAKANEYNFDKLLQYVAEDDQAYKAAGYSFEAFQDLFRDEITFQKAYRSDKERKAKSLHAVNHSWRHEPEALAWVAGLPDMTLRSILCVDCFLGFRPRRFGNFDEGLAK
ncbi:hypothetical protein K445DRAFT_72938 [Daldinia sp. EC12]|nr:hypothetical protein K445DRAFT_72938 [Daldinia sp. EC12]